MGKKSNRKPRVARPDRGAVDVIIDECLARRVLMLTRTIGGLYNEALRPLGVTVAQLNLLVIVTKRGPVSPGEVAKRLNMEKSTMSRNVRLTEDHGWLSVSPGPSGRSQSLTIQPKGRKLIEKALPLWQGAQERASELLGERGARSIYTIADTVSKQLAHE
ncbi:MAG: MarR family transcriptional regulator [Polyangiales bacterium]